MALTVDIYDASTRYRLQANTITISHKREPKVAPLPGGNPLLIDLGQRSVSLLIEGKCNESGTDETEDAINIADRDDLEIIARDWGDTETVTVSDNTPPSPHIYTVKIDGVTLARREANSFYDFTLRCSGFISTLP